MRFIPRNDDENYQHALKPGSEEHYRRIRRNYVRLIEEFQQIIRDTEYWNQINPTETPFDVEWARVSIVRLRRCLAAWDARDTILSGQLMQEHIEAMEADDCPL